MVTEYQIFWIILILIMMSIQILAFMVTIWMMIVMMMMVIQKNKGYSNTSITHFSKTASRHLVFKYYVLLECLTGEPSKYPGCCNGYLSIGTLDFNFEPSSYYETNWPSQFFAQIIRTNRAIPATIPGNPHWVPTCCFKLTSADESKTIVVSPNSIDMYEFEEEKPVHNIVSCQCGNIFCL